METQNSLAVRSSHQLDSLAHDNIFCAIHPGMKEKIEGTKYGVGTKYVDIARAVVNSAVLRAKTVTDFDTEQKRQQSGVSPDMSKIRSYDRSCDLMASAHNFLYSNLTRFNSAPEVQALLGQHILGIRQELAARDSLLTRQSFGNVKTAPSEMAEVRQWTDKYRAKQSLCSRTDSRVESFLATIQSKESNRAETSEHRAASERFPGRNR